MKRKVVVKVYSMNGQKSRSKALKIVVGVSGVESATLKGEEMVEVTGDDIDAVVITLLLRKKLGFAELVAVALVEEKKDKADEKEKDQPIVVQPSDWSSGVPYGTTMPYYVEEIKYNNNDPACCSIM